MKHTIIKKDKTNTLLKHIDKKVIDKLCWCFGEAAPNPVYINLINKFNQIKSKCIYVLNRKLHEKLYKICSKR